MSTAADFGMASSGRNLGAIRAGHLDRLDQLVADGKLRQEEVRLRIESAYQQGLAEQPGSMIKFIRDKVWEQLPHSRYHSLTLAIRNFLLEKKLARLQKNSTEIIDLLTDSRHAELLFRQQFLDGVTAQSPKQGAYGTATPIFDSDCGGYTPAFGEWKKLRRAILSTTSDLRENPPKLG